MAEFGGRKPLLGRRCAKSVLRKSCNGKDLEKRPFRVIHLFLPTQEEAGFSNSRRTKPVCSRTSGDEAERKGRSSADDFFTKIRFPDAVGRRTRDDRLETPANGSRRPAPRVRGSSRRVGRERPRSQGRMERRNASRVAPSNSWKRPRTVARRRSRKMSAVRWLRPSPWLRNARWPRQASPSR